MSSRSARLSLVSRLVISTSALLTAVIVMTSFYFARAQREATREDIARQKVALRDELKKRGEALAKNVAMSSERAVAVLDFLFLSEVIDGIVAGKAAGGSGFLYGIIQDQSGRAVVHSDHSLAGVVLSDEAAKFAALQTQPTSQDNAIAASGGGGTQVLESIAPVMVGSQRWGTIRLGLSLDTLNRQVAESEALLEQRFYRSVTALSVVSILVLLIGSLVGLLIARAVTQPLRALTQGVRRVREGDLNAQVATAGPPEFLDLADAFNEMTRAVNARDAELKHNNARLQTALEEAEEASRLKSEFLSNISHELRTPLNSIVNVPIALMRDYENVPAWHCASCQSDYTPDADDPIAEDMPPPPCPECQAEMRFVMRTLCRGNLSEHRHFLQRLKQSSQHLLSVVNDLLDFSKLGAGKMTLHREPFDARSLLADVYDTMSPIALERRVTLEMNTTTENYLLTADRLKTSQILINLVGNALKFTPPSGEVKVTLTRVGEGQTERLRFSVHDTGPGIAPEHHTAIFESFRQVDGSHTRKHGGTGLGLSITRQLVELHNGKIWVDSEVGRGSVFHFELPGPLTPVTNAPSLQDPVANSSHPSLRPHLVVVDDSQSQLELTSLVLEQAGYATTQIEISNEARARIAALRPAAVILDLMMPEMSGAAVLRDLKADPRTSRIPVIVSSAYHHGRAQVEELGGLWMPKPWDGPDMLRMVSRVLAESSGAARANDKDAHDKLAADVQRAAMSANDHSRRPVVAERKD